VTLNVPEEFTVIEREVALLDQRYELATELVSVTLPPWQNVVAPDGVMVGVGVAVPLAIVIEAVPVQVLVPVTVTVYVLPAVSVGFSTGLRPLLQA
jgi:hypothetical protein